MLGRRAALDLFGQEPPNTPEHTAGVSLLQEGTDVTAEQLANRFADHLERQAIASDGGGQLHPLRGRARELLGNQQHPCFIGVETAELQCAH